MHVLCCIHVHNYLFCITTGCVHCTIYFSKPASSLFYQRVPTMVNNWTFVMLQVNSPKDSCEETSSCTVSLHVAHRVQQSVIVSLGLGCINIDWTCRVCTECFKRRFVALFDIQCACAEGGRELLLLSGGQMTMNNNNISTSHMTWSATHFTVASARKYRR